MELLHLTGATAATADTRSTFSRWEDGTLSATRTIAASPGAVYTIVMATEYRLMRLFSGAGSVGGSDAFYAAGSTVQLTATAGAGYQFASWSGSATGTANPLTVTMNGPKTVTANFTLGLVGVLIDSNVAAAFSVSGAGCPAGTYTAPAAASWIAGSSCNINVVSPQGGTDTGSCLTDGPMDPLESRAIIAAPSAIYACVVCGIQLHADRFRTRQRKLTPHGFYPSVFQRFTHGNPRSQLSILRMDRRGGRIEQPVNGSNGRTDNDRC